MPLIRFPVFLAQVLVSHSFLKVDWISSESSVSSKFDVAEDGLVYLIDNQSLHILHQVNGSHAFIDLTTAETVSEYGGVAYTSNSDTIHAFRSNGSRQFALTRSLYNFGPVHAVRNSVIAEIGYFALGAEAAAETASRAPPPFRPSRFGMIALNSSWACPETLHPSECEAQQEGSVVQWRFDDFSQLVRMEGILMTYTYAISGDATVYAHTAEWNGTLNIGYFTAIRNGAVLWRTRHGPCHALHGEPVLGADNTLYQGFYTGMDHEGLAILSAWNLTDGKMKWATEFPTRFDHNYISFSAKVRVASDGSLRVATQDRTGEAESDYLNTLYAVDTRGELLWSCSLPSGKLPGWVDGLPSQLLITIGPNDTTFARVNQTKIAAVSAEGTPLWTESVTSQESDILQSFVVHVDGTMYAVIQHGQADRLATSSMYALNLDPILGESDVLVV